MSPRFSAFSFSAGATNCNTAASQKTLRILVRPTLWHCPGNGRRSTLYLLFAKLYLPMYLPEAECSIFSEYYSPCCRSSHFVTINSTSIKPSIKVRNLNLLYIWGKFMMLTASWHMLTMTKTNTKTKKRYFL